MIVHRIHEIKLAEQFCDAVYDGRKSFEIRKDDRQYRVDDLIKFIPVRNVNGKIEEFDHPLSKLTFRIDFLIDGWGLKDGYVAFAIKGVDTDA